MRKYLLSPLPLLIGMLLQWAVHAVGDPKMERGEISPGHVFHFADFWILIGAIMSILWLLACAVNDALGWWDRRPLRKLLREERKHRGE